VRSCYENQCRKQRHADDNRGGFHEGIQTRTDYVVPTPRLTAVWNKCRFQNHRSLVTGFGSEKSWWGQLITREKLTAWGINLTWSHVDIQRYLNRLNFNRRSDKHLKLFLKVTQKKRAEKGLQRGPNGLGYSNRFAPYRFCSVVRECWSYPLVMHHLLHIRICAAF
jgi:hypothetical protein